MRAKLFVLVQYLLPHHWLSRLTGYLANCRVVWIKRLLIQAFARQYQVNMQEAARESLDDYTDFNDFFTRALKPDARPVDPADDCVVSPADGVVSQLGSLDDGRLLQAKGRHYSLLRLLGDDLEKARLFSGGSFITIYLSPRDYHRVHMPLDGHLTSTTYVPGRLFSVNETTAQQVPDLFARNERLIAYFDTAAGPMAMILVGAMIVAGIETVWQGQVTPPERCIRHQDFTTRPEVFLRKGEEMGRFKLGSTVILLFGPQAISWLEKLQPTTSVQMGLALAQLQSE